MGRGAISRTPIEFSHLGCRSNLFFSQPFPPASATSLSRFLSIGCVLACWACLLGWTFPLPSTLAILPKTKLVSHGAVDGVSLWTPMESGLAQYSSTRLIIPHLCLARFPLSFPTCRRLVFWTPCRVHHGFDTGHSHPQGKLLQRNQIRPSVFRLRHLPFTFPLPRFLSSRLFPAQNLKEHRYEKILGYVGLGIAVGGVIFAFFWNIFWPGYDRAEGCRKL